MVYDQVPLTCGVVMIRMDVLSYVMLLLCHYHVVMTYDE